MAFVMKWVVTQGDVVAHSDREKKKWSGFVLHQRLDNMDVESVLFKSSKVGIGMDGEM